MTKRISYIDNTRAILIALVVLGHILNYANPKYDICTVCFGAAVFGFVSYAGILHSVGNAYGRR